MAKLYKLPNPVYSNIAGVVRPDGAPSAFEGLLPFLRFTELTVVRLKRDPDHKESWGLVRGWVDSRTNAAVFSSPSVAAFGFRSEDEAQKLCDKLNKRRG